MICLIGASSLANFNSLHTDHKSIYNLWRYFVKLIKIDKSTIHKNIIVYNKNKKKIGMKKISQKYGKGFSRLILQINNISR